MGGNQLAGSTLALCVGDLNFSLLLFADGVSLAVPLSAVLVSSCLLLSTVPFLCPFPFGVRGQAALGGKTGVALMQLGKSQIPH